MRYIFPFEIFFIKIVKNNIKNYTCNLLFCTMDTMKKILAVTTNEDIIKIVQVVCKSYSEYFDDEISTNTADAINFISYELPEIKVLDFTSTAIDCEKILHTIDSDPWLHNGGIIAVVSKTRDVQTIEEKKDPNIIIVQTITDFVQNFARIVKILWNNQQFLFNRGMQEQLRGREAGNFICETDPMDIRIYTTFLVNYLYSSNRITFDDRFALQTALMELLTNALEHGNCHISYDEKTQWLLSGNGMIDLIRKKLSQKDVAEKKIHISYLITPDKSYFKIRDEGDGFDWRAQLKEEEDQNGLHGRGIKLTQQFVQNIKFNDKGNEVSFEIDNIQNKSNTIPMIMESFETITCENKEVICRQNEPTNHLFFIVSGRYAVYSSRKLVSVLTPNDMFIGEMSFLLNDRRSATILAVGQGQLLKIPKSTFLNLIRKNPHYGIFLSKLLAHRLVRQTKQTISLSTEITELKNKLGILETI